MHIKYPFSSLRNDIPLLHTLFQGSPLIYFDNAATTHKPQTVIDTVSTFYAHEYASVGRGIYTLAEQATSRYEDARAIVAQFIGARYVSEIVFTAGATASNNMIAAAWAHAQIQAGDRIVVSALEHHSNLLVWQQLVRACGAELVIIPLTSAGTLDIELAQRCITQKAKLVAICHVSHMLGTRVDIRQLADMAHAVNARLIVDASQSIPHGGVQVQELACDMLFFSGHKIMGPTGIGVTYIRRELHEQLQPYQLGGGMVYSAEYHNAVWREMPYLLEAGTPPIAQALGLAAALNYFTANLSAQSVQTHEAALTVQLIQGLQCIPGIHILGPLEQLCTQGHIVSFVCEGFHAHDIAAYLNTYNICVRAGHHCAQPLAQSLGVTSSVRVSFYWYNTSEEVTRFLDVLAQLMRV